MRALALAGLLVGLPSTGWAAGGYEFAVSAKHTEWVGVATPAGALMPTPMETRRAWVYGPYGSALECATRKTKVLRGDVRLIFDCQLEGGFESYEWRTR